jgi:hypothetical protein
LLKGLASDEEMMKKWHADREYEGLPAALEEEDIAPEEEEEEEEEGYDIVFEDDIELSPPRVSPSPKKRESPKKKKSPRAVTPSPKKKVYGVFIYWEEYDEWYYALVDDDEGRMVPIYTKYRLDKKGGKVAGDNKNDDGVPHEEVEKLKPIEDPDNPKNYEFAPAHVLVSETELKKLPAGKKKNLEAFLKPIMEIRRKIPQRDTPPLPQREKTPSPKPVSLDVNINVQLSAAQVKEIRSKLKKKLSDKQFKDIGEIAVANLLQEGVDVLLNKKLNVLIQKMNQ